MSASDARSLFDAPDPGLRVRRFMSLDKFTRLIESRALYFAPASKFDDAREGHYTDLDHAQWDNQLHRWVFSEAERKMARQAKDRVVAHNQKATVISCWTTATPDNGRMWREYGRGEEAVAVETTVGRLRSCLGPEFVVAAVIYLDFTREQIRKGHSLYPFLYKQRSFEWESEVRIIGDMERGAKIESARLAPVDPTALIEKVIVSPAAHDGFRERVHSFVTAALPHISIDLA